MTAAAEASLVSPYRGLAAFDESELGGLLFFGRERETEVVTANLIASRLTVLYGPSGVGKSSLVRAGVARRVRELGAGRTVARGPDLACVVFASWVVEDPVGALAAAIGDAVRPLVSPTAPEPPADSSLADVAEHWSSILDGDLCLVLDQLEEYFVYHAGGPRSLLDALPELVTRPALRANVLLSVRDDELARLGALKNRLPGVFENARRLERLDRDGARAAILGPLQRWNELHPADGPVDVEPELVDAVLEQAAVGDGAHVEAPYLQLVMERIWREEGERGSRLLRLSTLAEVGGAQAIVRDHLERALHGLDVEEQEAASRMFGHLVTPSGTKIAHRASDLVSLGHLGEARGRDLLAALGRERILRPLDDAGGEAGRYEIFHDVLAQPIIDWGHRRELLAERRASARRQRRLLVLASAALAAAAIMVAVAAYALVQRGHAQTQARRARASALAASALAQLRDDPELGLLLARAAARDERTSAAEDVLRSALQASRGRAVLRGLDGGALAVGFSGGRVVAVDRAGTLRGFAARTSPALFARPLGGRIRAAAFAADGSAVVVARRRLVEVRVLRGTGAAFAFRVRSPVRAVAIDGRGDRVAVASVDGRVTLRDAGGRVFAARPAFKPTALALDRAGRVLAAGGGGSAAVWRADRRRPVARIAAGGHVTGVALTADGSRVATAGADGAVRVWSLPGGRFTAIALAPSPLTGVAFAPDGTALVAGDVTGNARVFDAGDGHVVAVLARHRDAVTTAAWSPAARLLVTGSQDGTARIWDPGVAPELRLVARPTGCCTALAAGADGVLVAAGGRAIRYVEGRARAVYRQPSHVTALAAAGPAVVTGGADGRVRLWRAAPGRPVAWSLGAPVTAVAATPAAIAAAGSDGRVVVRSTAGRVLLSLREQHPVDGLAISHDGRLLAEAGGDDVARIRELRSGRLLHVLTGHTKPLTAVAFSPDDTVLATSSVDHDVRLWHVSTGRPDRLLRAHFAVVSGVAFSPDGRWLATAGPVTVGLWQVPSGTLLTFLGGPTGRVVGAAFADGGRDVVAASADGTVRSYRCDLCGGLDRLLRLADARLAATGRTLTPGERRRYVSTR